MNNQTQEALKMAIDYFELQGFSIERQATLEACKEALAQPAQEVGDAEIKQMLDDIEYYQKRVEELEQPAQEPVGYIVPDYQNVMHARDGHTLMAQEKTDLHKIPVYTHPAPSWQGLSDDEIVSKWNEHFVGNTFKGIEFTRAIEQALKEKNHG